MRRLRLRALTEPGLAALALTLLVVGIGVALVSGEDILGLFLLGPIFADPRELVLMEDEAR